VGGEVIHDLFDRVDMPRGLEVQPGRSYGPLIKRDNKPIFRKLAIATVSLI